jgi:hypothetical protein
MRGSHVTTLVRLGPAGACTKELGAQHLQARQVFAAKARGQQRIYRMAIKRVVDNCCNALSAAESLVK